MHGNGDIRKPNHDNAFSNTSQRLSGTCGTFLHPITGWQLLYSFPLAE